MARKQKILKRTRTVLAVIVFILFVLLFSASGKIGEMLRILPATQFVPAQHTANVVALVSLFLLALIFGRVYCSVMCPLGLLQDGIYDISRLGKKNRNKKYKGSKPHNVLRYIIMVAVIVCGATGYGFLNYYIEPFSNFGRIVTAFTFKSISVVLMAALMLVIFTVLVRRKGRVWCNSICAVGSIMSIPSRWSLFAPVIDSDKCTKCGKCARQCRASCIDVGKGKVDTSRCVMCLDCLDTCPSSAIDLRFRWKKSGKKKVSAEKTDAATDGVHTMNRRAFITSMAFMAGSLSLNAAPKLRSITSKSSGMPAPVPAGSKSIAHLHENCIACQLCVQSCPNNVLKASSRLDSFLQPRMVFDKGYCDPECTVCSNVCPAAVIQPVTVEQKKSISVGYAVLNREICTLCNTCADNCPKNAIIPIADDGGKKAGYAVLAERCVGCGLCEYNCPAAPEKAIKVVGYEVHREVKI